MTQQWHGSGFSCWARRMDSDRVLAAFDAEVRRNVRPDGSGARIEADPPVVRWVGADDQGWSGIAWSGLGDADAVIAGQVAYFAARGEQFEWKLYHSLCLGSRPCRGAHGGIAHGAWPAGNGAAMPWAKCPCRPGAGPTGDGSRTIQYRSATAPVQA